MPPRRHRNTPPPVPGPADTPAVTPEAGAAEPVPGTVDPGDPAAKADNPHFLEETLEGIRTNPPSSLAELRALHQTMRPLIRVSRARRGLDLPEVYRDTKGRILDTDSVHELKARLSPQWWFVPAASLPTLTRVATLDRTDYLLPTDRRAIRQWNRKWGAYTDRTDEDPVTDEEFQQARPQVRAAIKITAEVSEADNERRKHLPHPDPLELDPATVRSYERQLGAAHIYSVLREEDWEVYKDDLGLFDEGGKLRQTPFVLSAEEQQQVRTTAGTTREAFEEYKEKLQEKLQRHDAFVTLRQAAQAVREAESGTPQGGGPARQRADAIAAAVREALAQKGFTLPE